VDNSYDIAIIGGGAAGLSLLYAMHLQGIMDRYTIALIEPEAKDSNDRTWCFWSDEQDAAWQMFSTVVSHQWKIDEGHRQQAMDPFKYVQIRSKDFYRFVKDALESYPNLKHYSDKVERLSLQDENRLELASGESLKAYTVFDGRPPKLEDPRLIWQSFVGYRIRSAENRFDTDKCRLMDFAVPQDRGLQFMYLLPTAKNEALVEFTRFGKAVLSEEESAPVIKEYLEKMGIADFQIMEKEINKIPMSLSLNSSATEHDWAAQYIPIGVRAGVVKASTGFAFKSITDHAWRIAQALKNNRPLPTSGHSIAAWVYDELLLNLWQKKQNPIPKIFIRLFEVHPIERILRFLDEKTKWWEDFWIMFRMPWAPFFWSIGRSIKQRLRP